MVNRVSKVRSNELAPDLDCLQAHIFQAFVYFNGYGIFSLGELLTSVARKLRNKLHTQRYSDKNDGLVYEEYDTRLSAKWLDG